MNVPLFSSRDEVVQYARSQLEHPDDPFPRFRKHTRLTGCIVEIRYNAMIATEQDVAAVLLAFTGPNVRTHFTLHEFRVGDPPNEGLMLKLLSGIVALNVFTSWGITNITPPNMVERLLRVFAAYQLNNLQFTIPDATGEYTRGQCQVLSNFPGISMVTVSHPHAYSGVEDALALLTNVPHLQLESIANDFDWDRLYPLGPTLQTLEIDHNETDIPPGMGRFLLRCTNLRCVALEADPDTQTDMLRPIALRAPQLRELHLNMQSNEMKVTGVNLDQLDTLHVESISKIRRIEGLTNANQLQTLELVDFPDLTEVPRLPSIVDLAFMALPKLEAVPVCTTLQTLSVNSCRRINTLDNVLNAAANLTTLTISRLELLSSIPSLAHTALQTVYIGDMPLLNSIGPFPPTVTDLTLRNLPAYQFDNNNIATLHLTKCTLQTHMLFSHRFFVHQLLLGSRVTLESLDLKNPSSVEASALVLEGSPGVNIAVLRLDDFESVRIVGIAGFPRLHSILPSANVSLHIVHPWTSLSLRTFPFNRLDLTTQYHNTLVRNRELNTYAHRILTLACWCKKFGLRHIRLPDEVWLMVLRSVY